jgi:hypothetical protein
MSAAVGTTSAHASGLEDNIYIVNGHGSENLIEFETRRPMPPGYTLVTFSECATTSFLEITIAKVVKAFLDPANSVALQNPNTFELKKLLGDEGKEETPNIYKEGDLYPDLSCEFFLDWDFPGDRGKHMIAKSGLYKFPLTGKLEDFLTKKTINVNAGSFKSFQKENLEEVKDIYEGAIYPSRSYLDTLLVPENQRNHYIPEFRKKVTLPIEKIFELGGPGVYYWVICRGIGNSATNINNYYSYLHEKRPELAERYLPFLTTKFGSNWIRSYENIEKLMNENASDDALPISKKHKLKGIRNEMRKTVNTVTKIRRQSFTQANKHASMRRTLRRRSRRNLK